MNSPGLSPENISLLIDQVLKAKDPSIVGLKRILRKKEEESSECPLHTITLEEFSAPGKDSKAFSREERRILELEKQVADLNVALKRQRGAAINAVQASFSKGKAEGFAEGRAEGVAVTTASCEKRIDVLQQHIGDVLENFERAKRAVFGNAEHLVVKLSCAMVKKIIDREASVHHDVVLGVLKRALSYIGHHEKMVVRVAPRDLEPVAQRQDFWFPVAQRLKDITIEADERIEPGGCIIESNTGLIDARLGVQFEELAAIIEKTWGEVMSAPVQEATEVPSDDEVPPGTGDAPGPEPPFFTSDDAQNNEQ